MKMFQVGGCVRDAIMGIPTKDIDFAVEAESFDAMRAELIERGFTIFTENPEFLVVRAHFPKDHIQHGKLTADFVLCRRDGFSSDSRRPDEVFAGTLMDDLARRDFTMNAIAMDVDGTIIDPFRGRADIENGLIRFVGDPMTRLREDGLRALRGLRFMVTKGLDMHWESWEAINDPQTIGLLANVSTERIREELMKMFMHDTNSALDLLAEVESELRKAIFRDGLRLMPTMKS